MPHSLISYLEKFNAKERYFLVGQILGNPWFKPTPNFLVQLGNKLGFDIPDKLFCAMDYHLDWLYASLHLSSCADGSETFSNDDGFIKATQEDVDFLIAFELAEEIHLVMIEAKGVTSWTNKQMKSKALRLGPMFGDDVAWKNVIPHFVLMSPRPPQKLEKGVWPEWMAPGGNIAWIELVIPQRFGTKKVSCCNDTKPDAKGKNWGMFDRNY